VYQGSFKEYRGEIIALLARVRELSEELSNDTHLRTVNKVLDWIEDKPGLEVSLQEMAAAIGDATGGVETFYHMSALTGGKPMMKPVLKVEGSDGELHLLDEVNKVSDGEVYRAPGNLEVLASSRAELENKSFVYFRIADFMVEPKSNV
jgi:hypothetical protein